MSEPIISAMNQTCMNILNGFLVMYIGCKRSRRSRGHSSRVKAINHNREGLYLEYADYAKENKSNDAKNKDDPGYEPSITDLRKDLEVLTGLYPEEKRPTRDENGEFSLVSLRYFRKWERWKSRRTSAPLCFSLFYLAQL